MHLNFILCTAILSKQQRFGFVQSKHFVVDRDYNAAPAIIDVSRMFRELSAVNMPAIFSVLTILTTRTC